LKPRSARRPNSNVRAAEAFSPSEIFGAVADARHVAIAVSGGSDSLALLELARAFVSLRRASLAESGVPAFAGMTNTGFKVTALTFDHGLRAESAAEAAWVHDWCKARGIACRVLQWQGEKPSTGIQAAARVARYDALTREAKHLGADVLLTGHTVNDQAETVVMRGLRTQSAASLAGIWPETQWNGFRIARPLLGVSREALRDMLRVRNISWLDDPSNCNPRFERVRVREALDKGDVAAFGRVAAAAQIDVRAAAAAASRFFAAVTKDRFGVVALPLAAFSGLDALTQHLVLQQAYRLFGAGEAVSKAERERLFGWLRAPTSKRRTLGGVVFCIAKGKVAMVREVARIADLAVTAGGKIAWDQRFWIDVPHGLPAGAKVVPLARGGAFQRDHALPALVQQGLPCVLVAGEPLEVEFTCLRTLDFANEAPMLGSGNMTWAPMACGEDVRL
jgi:tRNA(Ile)-lysidine synthase